MRSFKGHSKVFQGHLHAGNSAGKAVEGGIHWYVEYLYQVPPNAHTKCVLLSKCHWVAMWLSNKYHNPQQQKCGLQMTPLFKRLVLGSSVYVLLWLVLAFGATFES